MEQIIHTENLTKHFGDVHAIENLSLSVREGEIYGFLGLNGAGKTTTIRMLLGMIHPTMGASYLFGTQINTDSYKLWNNVGYLVETPNAYPDLTVWENLEMIRRLRNISDKLSVENVITQMKLSPYKNRKAKNLSLGNAQRLGLAKALLHNPKILILDEPTNGLDPLGIIEIRELLQSLASNLKTTIFISSHILGEVSKFATRIGIIHKGRMIQEVDTAALEQTLKKVLIIRTINNDAAEKKLLAENYRVIRSPNNSLKICDNDAIKHPENIARLLVKAEIPPTMLVVDEEDLESYFLRTIGENGQ